MQTTAIGTVANSLPENEVILLTILISDGYIPYTELDNIFRILKISKLKLQKETYSITTTKVRQVGAQS